MSLLMTESGPVEALKPPGHHVIIKNKARPSRRFLSTSDEDQSETANEDTPTIPEDQGPEASEAEPG
jgi:hypothetical protein